MTSIDSSHNSRIDYEHFARPLKYKHKDTVPYEPRVGPAAAVPPPAGHVIRPASSPVRLDVSVLDASSITSPNSSMEAAAVRRFVEASPAVGMVTRSIPEQWEPLVNPALPSLGDPDALATLLTREAVADVVRAVTVRSHLLQMRRLFDYLEHMTPVSIPRA